MGQASSRDAGSVLPDRGPLTHRIMLAFRATRPFSFPCSVMPVLVATAAVRPIGEWLWGRFAASLVAVLGVHICANLLNDYFDFMSGLDVEEDGFTGRPGRMLVSGEIKRCISTDIYGTGMTFPQLRAQCNACGGGGSISAVQKPGRLAGHCPEIGKKAGFLFEISEDQRYLPAEHRYMQKDSDARMRQYRKLAYNVAIHEVIEKVKL